MDKYGFIYIWFDRKHKRYYVGCRWGNVDDGYVCSSRWMKQAYGHRPNDFKRRILKRDIPSRKQTYTEEQHYLDMIKAEEIGTRYYNLCTKNNKIWSSDDTIIKSIGQKISLAKTGKKLGPCSPEKARRISEGKKAAFAARGGISEEQKERLRTVNLGRTHTEEWKQQNRERLKQQWSDGTRKRKV